MAGVGRARASLSREAVIETAIECMADEGRSALGINRVARALGIRPPSLYHYVRSNADLHSAVALRGWRQLADRVRVATAQADPAAGGWPAEGRPSREARRAEIERRLVLFAVELRAFVEDNPALHQTMAVTAVPGDDPRRQEIDRLLMECLSELLAPFDVDASTQIHAMRALRAATHGFALLEEAGQLPTPDDRLGDSQRWLLGAISEQLAGEP